MSKGITVEDVRNATRRKSFNWSDGKTEKVRDELVLKIEQEIEVYCKSFGGNPNVIILKPEEAKKLFGTDSQDEVFYILGKFGFVGSEKDKARFWHVRPKKLKHLMRKEARIAQES